MGSTFSLTHPRYTNSFYWELFRRTENDGRIVNVIQLYGLTYLRLFARWEHRPLPGVPWTSSLRLPWGVPYDGFIGDGFWRFSKRVHLHFLFFISFSTGSCLGHFPSVVLGTLSDHFRCRIVMNVDGLPPADIRQWRLRVRCANP